VTPGLQASEPAPPIRCQNCRALTPIGRIGPDERTYCLACWHQFDSLAERLLAAMAPGTQTTWNDS